MGGHGRGGQPVPRRARHPQRGQAALCNPSRNQLWALLGSQKHQTAISLQKLVISALSFSSFKIQLRRKPNCFPGKSHYDPDYKLKRTFCSSVWSHLLSATLGIVSKSADTTSITAIIPVKRALPTISRLRPQAHL